MGMITVAMKVMNGSVVSFGETLSSFLEQFVICQAYKIVILENKDERSAVFLVFIPTIKYFLNIHSFTPELFAIPDNTNTPLIDSA